MSGSVKVMRKSQIGAHSNTYAMSGGVNEVNFAGTSIVRLRMQRPGLLRFVRSDNGVSGVSKPEVASTDYVRDVRGN